MSNYHNLNLNLITSIESNWTLSSINSKLISFNAIYSRTPLILHHQSLCIILSQIHFPSALIHLINFLNSLKFLLCLFPSIPNKIYIFNENGVLTVIGKVEKRQRFEIIRSCITKGHTSVTQCSRKETEGGTTLEFGWQRGFGGLFEVELVQNEVKLY